MGWSWQQGYVTRLLARNLSEAYTYAYIRIKINNFSETFLQLWDKWRLPLTWYVSESKIALAEISSESFPFWKRALLMPVHYIFIVSRSICSLSTLNYSFNFRFAIWCGTSIISSDLQSAFVHPSIICFSAFKPFYERPIIFKEGKGGEYCQKTLRLPWCLLTWQYSSMHFIHRFISVSPSTEFGFYFQPQQTEWGFAKQLVKHRTWSEPKFSNSDLIMKSHFKLHDKKAS